MAPIHVAANTGNLEEVERLIRQDPQVVHSRDDGNGYTPLHYACKKGLVGVVACLLSHGVHIDQVNHNVQTAYYLACWMGHTAVVELLLEKGANPAIPSLHGVTPLMMASMHGRVDVVACNLHHPHALATMNHRNRLGRTALWYACSDGHGGVVRLLLEAGADPTMASLCCPTTPMEIAKKGGKHDCVVLLEVRRVGDGEKGGDELSSSSRRRRREEAEEEETRRPIAPFFLGWLHSCVGSLSLFVCFTHDHVQEWERHYLLTKARQLHDASLDDVIQSPAHHHGPSSSSSSTTSTVMTDSQVKRARIKATPAYLQERVEKDKPLPKVEVAVAIGGVERGRVNREIDRGLLVKVVVEYVVCGGLRGVLFKELREMLGRTGYRKEEVE